MSARNKLNSMYTGALTMLAAFIGAVFQSWLVFAVALAVLVVMNLSSGNIRPSPSRRYA